MKKLLLFFIITVLTSAQEIIVSGIQYPNTPIKLDVGNKSGEWKIESKPIYSSPILKTSENNKAVFIADVVGEFELSFIEAGTKEKTIKKIKVVKFNQFNQEFDEKEIYDIITESFKSKNYKLLEYGINTLKVNYPTSDYLQKAYTNAVKLCQEQSLYEEGKQYIEILAREYKYTEEKKIKYFEMAYEYYNFFDKKDEKMYYLIELSKYKDLYKEELGKTYLYKKATEKKGLSILEKLYKKHFSKELAKFLGDYYLAKNNNEKAIKYYGNSNKVSLAKLYLKNSDKEDYDKIKEKLTDKEVESLKAFLEEESIYSKMKNYYRYAKNNIEKDRLELAEIYLKRIVKQDLNNDLKKESAEKLVELYIIQERYDKAISVYDTYLDENMSLKDVELLYNKGIIYTKLNNKEKSLEIFKKLAQNYPETIWARKASISIYKMTKN